MKVIKYIDNDCKFELKDKNYELVTQYLILLRSQGQDITK